MAWSGLVLTFDGRNALNKAQLSNKMNFKSIVVGDGAPPNNYGTQKELVHQLYEITELDIDLTEDGCTIIADFPEVQFDYYFREIGLIITTDEGDKLYVYDNCGDDAQYIVTTTGVEKNKKRLRLSLVISDVEQITVSTPGILYATYDDFQQMTGTLKEHMGDEENPHKVTKAQVGLDNVPNVATNDQTPTFTSTDTLTGLTSGEKLSVTLGKIARAVADLISHIGNESNPHGVTKSQIGLGSVENKSSAAIRNEITSANVTAALGYTPLNPSLKGKAGGLAELDSGGKVPSSQLPAFVDDVLEYSAKSSFPDTGETGKIYVDLSTNKTYRWSGSAYVEISASLALGETSSTAYRGDRGKTAYDHSQAAHARTDATNVKDSATNGNILIDGVETNVYTHQNSGVTAGTYRNVTVNAQGHVTGGTNPTTLSGYGITDAASKEHTHNTLSVQSENYKQSTDLPSTYPQGETIFFSNNPTNTFNNMKYCTVHTIKGYSNMVCIQWVYPYNTNLDTIYYRTAAYGSDTWRSWKTISVSDHTHNYAGSSSAGGAANTATKLAAARTIDGVSFDGSSDITHYGVCSTTNGYNAKVVSCAGFQLVTGATIRVKFTAVAEYVENDGGGVRLNVNNTGEKDVLYKGSYPNYGYFNGNQVQEFVYDGTSYILIGGADTNTDTKNTAGSTDSSSKLFLIGAASQAANPQTYSHDTAYIGEDGCLYSDDTKVSVEGHTHNYAGSGSAGGAATSANALNTINIPASADLNSYHTSGFYGCPANATVATLTNAPTLCAFFMVVGKHAGTYQEVTEYMTNNPKKYMRNLYDGVWGSWYRIYTTADAPPDTTYDVVSTTADGLAPKRDGSTTKYLRADGTWAVPPDTNTVYVHPDTSGNKHIPAGGSSGQILRWSADGTAVWGDENNTTDGIAAGEVILSNNGVCAIKQGDVITIQLNNAVAGVLPYIKSVITDYPPIARFYSIWPVSIAIGNNIFIGAIVFRGSTENISVYYNNTYGSAETEISDSSTHYVSGTITWITG